MNVAATHGCANYVTGAAAAGGANYATAAERFRGQPPAVRLATTLMVVAIHALAVLFLLQYAAPRTRVLDGTPLQVTLFSEEATQPVEIPVPTPQLLPPAIDIEIPVIDLTEVAAEPEANTAITVAMAAPSKPATKVAPAPRLIDAVEYLREPHPRYPPTSRRLGEEGLVVLRVLIDAQGDAREIDLQRSSGHERLDQAAREAVARAEFKPYTENGRALPAIVLIPIEFSLARSARSGG